MAASAASSSTSASSSSAAGSTSGVGDCVCSSLKLETRGRVALSTCTKIGRRKTQEDRLVVCPRVRGRDDISIFCVFDGTVGDHAANYCHEHFPSNLEALAEFNEAIAAADKGDLPSAKTAMGRALRKAFAETDGGLIRSCHGNKALDYVSSTGVVGVLVKSVMSIAHVGDSRIAMGWSAESGIRGESVTADHKPDQETELRRIEAAGGSLIYLHGGKPFIRGGDFTARQAMGDRPMQLNYSRAFGGKDLKPYGLSCEPDVKHIDLTEKDKVFVFASDGLWDVVSAQAACSDAVAARARRTDPAEHLVDKALAAHDAAGSVDNVTVVTAFLDISK